MRNCKPNSNLLQVWWPQFISVSWGGEGCLGAEHSLELSWPSAQLTPNEIPYHFFSFSCTTAKCLIKDPNGPKCCALNIMHDWTFPTHNASPSIWYITRSKLAPWITGTTCCFLHNIKYPCFKVHHRCLPTC